MPAESPSPDQETVRLLREDLALQIARHVRHLGLSQVDAARAFGIPQPTLSKIVHGRVADLSLELMIRIASRAQLQLVLLTGKSPAEAGVFVGGTAAAGRAQHSELADRAREALSARHGRLSPEQRLDAQLRHNELLADLRRGGGSPRGHLPGGRPDRKRTALTRDR
jgi:predicted XRE-type DNA-binding protein